MKHHYYFCKKLAFTLPEVLITLGIIGIVAMLVLPTIHAYYFEKMVVAKVKQTYSIMSNAVEQAIEENDCEFVSCWKEISNYNKAIEPIANELDKHFKYTQKICTPLNGTVAKISWLPDYAYTIKGEKTTQPVHSITNNNVNNICYYQLNNGVNISIYRLNSFDANGADILYIVMDANGKSRPNRVGKDIFIFTSAPSSTPTYSGYTNAKRNRLTGFFAMHPYVSSSIHAAGLCADLWTWVKSPTCKIRETTPAAYVLNYDKLPDLTKAGFPAKP